MRSPWGVWQYLNAFTDRWYHCPEWADLSDEREWADCNALCA
jgi:hypothetical protein